MPKLLVSSTDGSLICWSVDTEGAAFKFNMTKKGKTVYFLIFKIYIILYQLNVFNFDRSYFKYLMKIYF